MSSDLASMKNLGSTTINWLHAVGINSCAELREAGAVNAYNRIRLRGIKVSRVLLYALHAALLNISWNELCAQTKQQLVAQADEAIAEQA